MCSYIHQKPRGGIHEYLCNRLFELADDSVEHILSQLCELAVNGPNPSMSLQRTLVGLASRSTRNAIKVCPSRAMHHAAACPHQPFHGSIHVKPSQAQDAVGLQRTRQTWSSRTSDTAPNLQIYWLLRTMAYDQKRKTDNKGVIALLTACQQAATAPKLPASPRPHSARTSPRGTDTLPGAPELATLRRHTTNVVIPSAGPCEGLSQVSHSPTSTPGASAGRQMSADSLVDTGVQHERLSTLHEQLGGVGEGVSELVRASLCDISNGGTGVVAAPEPPESPRRGGVGAAECFTATVDFFDLLCDSSAALVPLPPAKRPSAMRAKMEDINARLHQPELQGKVCFIAVVSPAKRRAPARLSAVRRWNPRTLQSSEVWPARSRPTVRPSGM